MIVDKINAYLSTNGIELNDGLMDSIGRLSAHNFKRQFGIREIKRGVQSLRLSSIGKCMREQSYAALGFELNGKEMDSRSKMVFYQGDMTELAIIYLAHIAGCAVAAFGEQQMSVQMEGIVGHPDGVVFDNGKTHLLEIKSMPSYAFNDFERGEISESYLYQANAYMKALGLQTTVYVAMNKDAGVIAERILSLDDKICDKILDRIKILKAVTIGTLPERPYKPNKAGFYPWNCLFCSYWKTCLPDAERVLVGKSYKLKDKNFNGDNAKKDKDGE